MTIRKFKVFLPLDPLAWGLPLLLFAAAGVGVLVAGHGAERALALIPVVGIAIFLRRWQTRAAFARTIWTYTVHGVGVRMAALEPSAREIGAIEAGTKAAISFWQGVYPMRVAAIFEVVNGVLCTLQPEVTREWKGAIQQLDGMQIPRAIIVRYVPGTTALSTLEAEVRHEMGHLILEAACGVLDLSGGETHHAVFAREGFA